MMKKSNFPDFSNPTPWIHRNDGGVGFSGMYPETLSERTLASEWWIGQ